MKPTLLQDPKLLPAPCSHTQSEIIANGCYVEVILQDCLHGGPKMKWAASTLQPAAELGFAADTSLCGAM